VPAPVAKEIKKLEAKAVETTLQDIKASDPTLFNQVVPVAKEAKVTSEVLNNRTVEQLFKTAPPAPKKSKPTRKELEEGDDNSYDKYFKMVN
jgi:hypothetical protein